MKSEQKTWKNETAPKSYSGDNRLYCRHHYSGSDSNIYNIGAAPLSLLITPKTNDMKTITTNFLNGLGSFLEMLADLPELANIILKR